MSLFLGDQKLGSHSQPGSSSHKFMLKGRQTGSMHRGHTWVFRAETYDTMLAWYDDIKSLTESSTEERHAFVRKHARSFSQNSAVASSVSGESAMEEDEADQVPYSANESITVSKELDGGAVAARPQRPSPGGRFPSDLQVPYQRAHSVSSGESDERGPADAGTGQQDLSVIAGGLQHQGDEVALPLDTATGGTTNMYAANDAHKQPLQDTRETKLPYHPSQPPFANPVTASDPTTIPHTYQPTGIPTNDYPKAQPQPDRTTSVRPSSQYGEWMAPAAVGAGAATAAVGTEGYWRTKRQQAEGEQVRNNISHHVGGEAELSSPAMTESTAPTSVSGTDLIKDHAAPMVAAAIPTPVRTAPPNESIPAPVEFTSTDAKELLPPPLTTNAGATAALAVTTTGLPTAQSQSRAVESPTAYDTDPVTGKPNAKLTGAVFPSVIRHDTDVSVSGLHIPGEFPRSPEA